MENAQKVWILYDVLLILNFLIGDEQTVATESHQIMRSVNLNQTIF